MSLKTWGMIALGTAVGVAGAVPASAQSAQAVEHSGRTFHVAVCARGNPHGTARCFAHVVTGCARHSDQRQVKSPIGTPSGYGPQPI